MSADTDIDAAWDFEDAAGSEARFRRALEGEDDSGRRCEILTQIARSQGLQRRFDEGLETLAEVLAMERPEPRCLIRIALEHGRILNSSGSPEEARPLFLRAWEMAVESGEEALEVDAAHMIAIVAAPLEALEWNERAIATATRSQDPKARKWMGSLLNNTGWTYHEMGNYERALELFTRALAFRAEQGKEPELGIARWCVARCLRSLGRLDEAWSMQTELKKDLGALCGGNGYVEEELGELLVAQGKADEAGPWFAAAYDKLSKDAWFAEREPERLERMRSLGRVEA